MLLNPRFSEQGAEGQGFASGWSLSASTSLVRSARISHPRYGVLGFEPFDEGGSYEEALQRLAFAFFEGGAWEGFGVGWLGGRPYLLALFEAQAVSADLEDFEWLDVWVGLWDDLGAGEIEAAPDDGLEVPDYKLTWAEVGSDAAVFEGPTNDEIFDDWTALP